MRQFQRITIDPEVMGGKPCIRGMRVTVGMLVDGTWNFGKQSEMHNFIQAPICMGKERLKNPNHPTQKPLRVLRKLLEIGSQPGDVVFDPFMGVGSTGVAALEMDRRFVGVELEEKYFLGAVDRIEDVQAQSRQGMLLPQIMRASLRAAA